MEEKAELELRLDDKAFEEMREELTKKYPRKWVTIFRGKVISVGIPMMNQRGKQGRNMERDQW